MAKRDVSARSNPLRSSLVTPHSHDWQTIGAVAEVVALRQSADRLSEAVLADRPQGDELLPRFAN